ncbi:MAG: xanthine dehydrogenase family protein subunit M [Pseudomonadales bacterium]|jgi:carbon-monoxide dehydrogenase medium subunit|nr:xanthine dehydrogenase family protein subunit M [Pseudomonadales bacterium]MDP7594974.1 xanthine dehydrogenase family protein subunit M [Pseudomonadales bacterium]HJN51236.1 xanthine dehydrogenase family protein subunit M [Pseudomonadales bacterium]|tara:strand:- start:675 stop:1547 length:873 start_codon:yes stop_codon:yes gene_type:complete
MVRIEYKAPQTLDEAVQLLSSCTDKAAKVLAGGTDLIIQLRQQVNNPHLIVDLKKIPEMMQASLTDDGLSIGPALCCAELTAREDIKAVFPGLVEAAYLIGSTQIQGRASIGGNLCNSSPAADAIPALIALQAECVILGPGGRRRVAAEDFVTGVQTNVLAKDEVLVEIVVPRPAAMSADAYLRFIPRTEMDIAVAGAGVNVSLDGDGVCTAARVAIGAVAPTALLVREAAAALIGTKLEEPALQAAGEAASAASKPITDRRGTIEFRKHIVGVLTRRAASTAAKRAKEK